MMIMAHVREGDVGTSLKVNTCIVDGEAKPDTLKNHSDTCPGLSSNEDSLCISNIAPKRIITFPMSHVMLCFSCFIEGQSLLIGGWVMLSWARAGRGISRGSR